jgi:hypothetical protein
MTAEELWKVPDARLDFQNLFGKDLERKEQFAPAFDVLAAVLM